MEAANPQRQTLRDRMLRKDPWIRVIQCFMGNVTVCNDISYKYGTRVRYCRSWDQHGTSDKAFEPRCWYNVAVEILFFYNVHGN